MENNREKETFNYTYSAKEQEEIRRIRKKYISPEEDKMERLRRLDASVMKKASAASLALGFIGALLLGFGMSLIMTDLSEFFNFYYNTAMFLGIIVGVIGLVLVSFAYPLYNYIVSRERRKIAPEILQLTDELMK